MKLLSIALARSIWLGHLDDFNPKGRNLMSIILPFLLDKYKFKKYPEGKVAHDSSKGPQFDKGEFINSEGEPILLGLTFFDFGISAETRSSTSDTDIFLESLLTQLHENFNIPHFKNIIRNKHYLSQLVFSTKNKLELINPKLKYFSDYLTNNIKGFGEIDYQLGGLSFWADPINKINPPNFIIERQAAIPFVENRYFSSIGLQTEKHLDLLNKFEKFLNA